MGINRWKGGAPRRRQVCTITVGGTIEVGDIFNAKLSTEGGTLQTAAAVSTTTSTITTAAELAEAINDAGGLFLAVNAEASGSTVVVSAADEGVPFTLTVTTTETGGGAADAQTISVATTIANSGPNDYNSIGNWSLNAVPIANDDVIIASGDSILYGLNQASVSLGSFSIDPSVPRGMTIGRPGEPLSILVGADKVRIDGAGNYYLNLNASAVAPQVISCGSNLTMSSGGCAQYEPGCYLLGSALTTVYVEAGHVEVATNAGDTSTVGAVIVAGGRCSAGSGVASLATWSQGAGTGAIGCAVSTAVYVDGGTLISRGSGAVPSLKINGGTYISNSTGTIASAVVNGGVLDMSKSHATRNVTSLLQNGGTVYRNTDAVTYANAQHEGGTKMETPTA